MKTFGFPTSIGRWGFQDQGGCTPLSCLAVYVYTHSHINYTKPTKHINRFMYTRSP